MNLLNVFVVFKNGEPQISKGGKLYHHAKQHAASSVRQLCKDIAMKKILKYSEYDNIYEQYAERERIENELTNEYEIKEFKLVEI